MCATPAGGEAAEQHEGRGDQSSERQNDQDGERHTSSGMFAPPVPPLQPITTRVNRCLSCFQDDDLNGEGGESPQREREMEIGTGMMNALATQRSEFSG